MRAKVTKAAAPAGYAGAAAFDNLLLYASALASSSFSKNCLIYTLFSSFSVGINAIYLHFWKLSPSRLKEYPVTHFGLQSSGFNSLLHTEDFRISFFIFSGRTLRKSAYFPRSVSYTHLLLSPLILSLYNLPSYCSLPFRYSARFLSTQ